MVTDGRLVTQAPRAGGALKLSTLDRFVPADWLVLDGDVGTLAAAVVLTPAQVLTLGGDVRAVRLAGGPTASDAASIYTGRGRLAFRQVNVSSVDPTTGQGMPVGPGRPFIVVSGGGHVDAVDSAINDLGTEPAGPAPRAGLGLGADATGTLLRTAMLRNSIGLRLDRTQGVRLEDVTVSDSVADGLVLRGDHATAAVRVRADGNGANGVLVTGPSSDRPVTGISASRNTLFGIALVGQTGLRVADVVTGDNRSGGIRVSWSTDISVSALTSTADAIGVYTHVGSARIAVDRAAISGSRRGMHIEKTTRGVTIDDVDQGIRARSTGVVEVDDADISALSVGVNAAPGTPVRLAGSHLDALEAIRGEVIQDGVKDLSLPPLNLLGAIGVPLVVLALLLELVDNYRHRGTERTERRAPPDLTVTARVQLARRAELAGRRPSAANRTPESSTSKYPSGPTKMPL